MKQVFAMLLVMVTLTACTVKENFYHINDKKTAVVAILEKDKNDPNQGGVGTGFFIDENYIITNFHVAGDVSRTIEVAMESGSKTYEAELVYGDKDTDIAVIKLKNWEEFKKDNPQVTYLKFAEVLSKNTDTVFAIGHPWGLFYSISKGIVSAEARKSPNPFPMWWIQTDAHVFQGNSGGPLLNEAGEVIGVNSVMVSREGGSYGFAIPVQIVTKVINDLKKYKEVRWLTLGISIEGPGVTIGEVTADGAAKLAGLEKGDQIISVQTGNSSIQNIDTAFELISYLSTLDYENELDLVVKRNDKILEVTVKPKFKLSSEYN